MAKDIVFYVQNTTTYEWVEKGRVAPNGVFLGEESLYKSVVKPVVEHHKLDLVKPLDREKLVYFASGAYLHAIEE